MTDTDRLAAALLLVHSWERETAESEARDILAADPTLVCPDPADHALADAALEYDEVNRDLESSGRHAEWWGKRNAFVRACDAYRAALEDKPEHECGFECSDTIAEEPPSPADDFCPDPADHALAGAVRGATTLTGILGWSNKRTGVEFYHSWDDGRWGQRQSRQYGVEDEPRGGWGRLLADDIEDELEYAEGRPVVVVVLDRGADIAAIAAALEDKP